MAWEHPTPWPMLRRPAGVKLSASLAHRFRLTFRFPDLLDARAVGRHIKKPVTGTSLALQGVVVDKLRDGRAAGQRSHDEGDAEQSLHEGSPKDVQLE